MDLYVRACLCINTCMYTYVRYDYRPITLDRRVKPPSLTTESQVPMSRACTYGFESIEASLHHNLLYGIRMYIKVPTYSTISGVQ